MASNPRSVLTTIVAVAVIGAAVAFGARRRARHSGRRPADPHGVSTVATGNGWSNFSTQKRTRMSDNTTETPVLDLLAAMTAASLEASNLDPKTFMIARIAALVAVNAPPASYLLNLGVATDAGVNADDVRGVLAAIAPIVGTPRIVGATGNIARALGFALDVAELEELEEEAAETA